MLVPGMTDLAASLPKLAGRKVLVLGDVMLDHYIAGEVDRISPEAPVPVVRVTSEWNLLGGAGNVARNIRALGGEPLLIGLRGRDHNGGQLQDILAGERIDACLIEDASRPTTIKTRIIAHSQQVVRVDWEPDAPVSEAVRQAVLDRLAAEVTSCGVVILSDYGKGLICPEFMAGFWEILGRLPSRPYVLADPKPVNYDCYAGVDLITPNTKEAGEGAGLAIKDKRDTIRAGIALFKRLKLRSLLITLGPQGMALFDSPSSVLHIPTIARKVFDVTGAGDTVISVVALGLAAGFDLLTSCLLANYAAGIVVGQVGSAVATPEAVARDIRELPAPAVSSWLDA